jgi:NAD-dependent histone deacetylase SIR2
MKKCEVYRCKVKEGCNGPVKPDIVFFGENLPKEFFPVLDSLDEADLLIVIGTALAVAPFN